jgi:hypothetical protein
MSAVRSFAILKYVKKVPTVAGCTACSLKFFAPTSYQGDPVGADQYLRGKFDVHNCEGKLPKRHWWS